MRKLCGKASECFVKLSRRQSLEGPGSWRWDDHSRSTPAFALVSAKDKGRDRYFGCRFTVSDPGKAANGLRRARFRHIPARGRTAPTALIQEADCRHAARKSGGNRASRS